VHEQFQKKKKIDLKSKFHVLHLDTTNEGKKGFLGGCEKESLPLSESFFLYLCNGDGGTGRSQGVKLENDLVIRNILLVQISIPSYACPFEVSPHDASPESIASRAPRYDSDLLRTSVHENLPADSSLLNGIRC
jgi:hypothetical protein